MTRIARTAAPNLYSFYMNHSHGNLFLFLGAVSKSIATVLTYPLQLAQTRQRRIEEGKLSTATILLRLLKKNGVPGLYQGLETKMLQTVLATALMFMCYEKIAQFVFILLLGSARAKAKK